MNVDETSYRNMSVSGVDDVFPSFNGRAQRTHESHDVHRLQWTNLKKILKTIVFTANSDGLLGFVLDQTCENPHVVWFNLSVQSQLLLLKAFPPPAAPMFLDHDSPLLQPAPDADATGSLPLPRLEPEPVETAERKPAVTPGDSM